MRHLSSRELLSSVQETGTDESEEDGEPGRWDLEVEREDTTRLTRLQNHALLLLNAGLLLFGGYYMVNSVHCALISHKRVEECDNLLVPLPILPQLYAYIGLMIAGRALYFAFLRANRAGLRWKGWRHHFAVLLRTRRRWSGEFLLWALMGFFIADVGLQVGYGEEKWGVFILVILEVVLNNLTLSSIASLNLVFTQTRVPDADRRVSYAVERAVWSTLFANLAVNLYLTLYDVVTMTLNLETVRLVDHYLSNELFLLVRGCVVWYRALMTSYYWNKMNAPDCTPFVPALRGVSELYYDLPA